MQTRGGQNDPIITGFDGNKFHFNEVSGRAVGGVERFSDGAHGGGLARGPPWGSHVRMGASIRANWGFVPSDFLKYWASYERSMLRVALLFTCWRKALFGRP